MHHNLFEENTYKYVLTGIDVSSSYKVARLLRTKTSSEVAFVLEAIYKKGGVLKYPKVFQCDYGSEFKNKVTKLLEKHNAEIRRATAKYKHTHTAFVEAFNKELAKLLFERMDAQWMLYQPGEQHGDRKRQATNLIWSKNTCRLDRIVQGPSNCVLYYLQDGPDRALVREELMHVSEDTQAHPDWVSEWT